MPSILAGEITVTEALGHSRPYVPADFFPELFQAMLDHWRAQAPEPPVDSPIVYALFRETSDQLGTSELVGVYKTWAKAEASGERIRSARVFIRKIIVDVEYGE
jgi:hypothetical protein